MALNKVNIAFKNFRDLKRYLRYEICVSRNRFSVYSGNKMSKTKIDPDEPIKYSSTASSKKTFSDIFGPKISPAILPIEKYLIFTSLLCFFIYFLFLRKENAIDRILEGSMENASDEVRLTNALLYAKMKKLRTDEIEEELKKCQKNK